MYLVYHKVIYNKFKLAMDERLTNQETLLLKIAQELGLDKPKQ